MNLTELHEQLTRLSDSERAYQAGFCFNSWEDNLKEIVNGREVFRVPYWSISKHGESLSNTGQNLWTMQEALTLKRNSRFNPVPEHIHSYIELNYVYTGRCPQVVDGTPVVLKQNQVLLIDTDCPHSIAALGLEDVMVSVLIPKGFLRENLFLRFSQSSVLSDFFINAINMQTDHNHFLLFHSENDRRIALFFRNCFANVWSHLSTQVIF